MSRGNKLGRFRRFFWDPPKDTENWAQTIVRVLGNIFRTSLACIALSAIALGAAVGIGAAINKQAEANDPANLVTAEIAIDGKNCDRQSPWRVQIRNDSTKVLIEGTFALSMRERGSSRKLQLGGWSGAPIVVHKFVPPEHTYSFCTNAFTKAVVEALRNEEEGVVLSDYELSLSLDNYTAEFQDKEDWLMHELDQSVRPTSELSEEVSGEGSGKNLLESDSGVQRLQKSDTKPWERDWNVKPVEGEFVYRSTKHGFMYGVPASWEPVSNEAFNAKLASVGADLPDSTKSALDASELIFAIGTGAEGNADAVLTMRVVQISPSDAITQSDLMALTGADRASFLNEVKNSSLSIEQGNMPGLTSIKLKDAAIENVGHVLCIRIDFDTIRDDSVLASYINWSCPFGEQDVSISAHVRRDKHEVHMPTIRSVLSSISFEE